MKWSRFIAFQTIVVPLILLGTVLLQLGSGSANANTGLTLDKKLSARDLIAQYGLNENTQILNQRVEAAGRVAARGAMAGSPHQIRRVAQPAASTTQPLVNWVRAIS
jgi:hypothetical protein